MFFKRSPYLLEIHTEIVTEEIMPGVWLKLSGVEEYITQK